MGAGFINQMLERGRRRKTDCIGEKTDSSFGIRFYVALLENQSMAVKQSIFY
jgi:hypothetical protein